MRLTAAGLLAWCVIAPGGAATLQVSDPPKVVEVPTPPFPKATEFRVAVGDQLQLKVDKPAVWYPMTPGCRVRTPDNANPSPIATFTAPAPGTYHVGAFNVDGFVPMVVVVTKDAPSPVPPDPVPVDPLVRDIRTAFFADKGKAADMQALAALYTLMVKECANPVYVTVGDLNGTFVKARDEMLTDPATGTVALPSVRARAGQEAGAVLGTDRDAPLTDAMRASAKDVYTKLAKAVTAAQS